MWLYLATGRSSGNPHPKNGGLPSDDFATIQVYGVTSGVKAADVIHIIWPEWDPYFCYRKRINKDKVMTEIRNDFNSTL